MTTLTQGDPKQGTLRYERTKAGIRVSCLCGRVIEFPGAYKLHAFSCPKCGFAATPPLVIDASPRGMA